MATASNRKQARMNTCLMTMGVDKYLALVEKKLGAPLARVPDEALKPARPSDRARISE